MALAKPFLIKVMIVLPNTVKAFKFPDKNFPLDHVN